MICDLIFDVVDEFLIVLLSVVDVFVEYWVLLKFDLLFGVDMIVERGWFIDLVNGFID